MSTHIHVSDMRQYKTCRIRWHFQSSLRLGLSPVATPKALWKGTLVHKALEAWYEEKKARSLRAVWEETWQQELLRLEASGAMQSGEEELVSLYETCLGILRTYAWWCPPNDENFEVIGVEQDFVVPLVPARGISFAGKFDQVVADKDGGVWIHDFKVMGGDFFAFANYLRDQDDQARAYCWAGKQLFGDQFRGIMYTLIRSKAPTAPVVLKKSGRVSANKSIDTTWETFRAALKANGQEYTEEYAEVKQAIQARAQKTPWVMRVFLTFNDLQLRVFEGQALALTSEMIKADVPRMPASYLTCRGCPFSAPCAALLNVGEKACTSLLERYYVQSSYAASALELQEMSEE